MLPSVDVPDKAGLGASSSAPLLAGKVISLKKKVRLNVTIPTLVLFLVPKGRNLVGDAANQNWKTSLNFLIPFCCHLTLTFGTI